jgi:chemotaxis protein MotB
MSKKSAHHGGAWKVAYADFVTAMMALFIVLWIIKERPQMAEEIAATFKRPLIGQKGGVSRSEIVTPGIDYEKMAAEQQKEKLDKIAAEMQKTLNVEDAEDRLMDIQVTSDGIKLTLFDRNRRPMFERDSSKLTKWGSFVMESLSWIIERNKMRVFIEGHASSTKGGDVERGAGVWDLSADRANSSRRALVGYALEPKWIVRVSGYGDSQLLNASDPNSSDNQRITLNLSLLK